MKGNIKMPAKTEKLSFEKALERLEEISLALESGNATLDKSLDLYNEGIKLLKQCNQMLDSAQKKISTVKSDDTE